MVSSFEQWFGKSVVLQLTTGETRVPLRGIIIAESGGAVRFRITGGWEFDVYKSMIRAVERDLVQPLPEDQEASPITGLHGTWPTKAAFEHHLKHCAG